jgi:hypothetical protein
MRHRKLSAAIAVVCSWLGVPAEASPWGDRPIGHLRELIVDEGSGRTVEVRIYYPAAAAGSEVVVYEHLLVPDARFGWIEVRDLFEGLTGPYFTADQFAASFEGRTVYADAAVAPGPHPAIINLPGGNGPGFGFIGKATIEASRGFVVANVTHQFAPNTPAGRCLLERDAKLVVDTILAWNRAAGHPLSGAIDEDALTGTGFSLGGRTWIARTSDVQLCELTAETRLRALSLQDPTWERTTVEQTTGNHTPTILQSQWCRFTQMKLQLELASAPARIDLEGWGVIDPILNPTPVAIGQGPLSSHNLFGHTCVVRGALLAAGHVVPTTPGTPVYLCALAETAERERRRALAVAHYGLTFFEHVLANGDLGGLAPAARPTALTSS